MCRNNKLLTMEVNVKSIEKKEEVLQRAKRRKPIIQEALIIDTMLYSVLHIKIIGDYSSLVVQRCSLTQPQDMQPVWHSPKEGKEGQCGMV